VDLPAATPPRPANPCCWSTSPCGTSFGFSGSFFHETLSRQTLDRQLLRLHELDALLSASDVVSDLDRFRALTREHAEASVIAEQYTRLTGREADLAGAEGMLAEAKNDPEMAAMAEEEIDAAKADIAQIDEALQLMLIPKDPDDLRPAFVEIRAGTGGDESALFAGDLFRMYTPLCRAQPLAGRNHQRITERAGRLQGSGAAHRGPADVTGVGVYGKLRFESGGHRVQRVPATETQGRIHTSACTVAVMPEPDEAVAIQINPADLRIDTYRASGAGGQHINKTDSAVRITHMPTGIVAECQEGRSQHSNKAQALKVLTARIHEKDRAERAAKDAALRKGLVGTRRPQRPHPHLQLPAGPADRPPHQPDAVQAAGHHGRRPGRRVTALQVARGAEQLAELETANQRALRHLP
jgi:peptide chain release factor 1